MAGGITNRKKNWLIFPTRLGKRFLAPRIPIDRIMRVLQKVRRLFARQPVRENVIGRFLFSHK